MDQMITKEEAQQLQVRGVELEERAQALAVTDTTTYEEAAALKVEIKERRARVMERPLKTQAEANSVKKFLDDIVRLVRAPFDRAEDAIDHKMIEYRSEVERKRQAEARKALEKANKEAQERRAREIAEAKRLKDKEAVEALKQAPLQVVAQAPKTPEPPKIKGMPVRKIWDFEVVNPNAIPRQYLIVDTAAVRSVVNGLKDRTQIPGIRVFQRDVQ